MNKSGVATLPVILLISSIVIELTIAGVVVSALLTNTVFSSRLSTEALAAARAGAQDGLVKIIRYKSCPTSCGGAVPYSITLGRATVLVEIIDNAPVNTLTVRSTATVISRKKMGEALVGVDTTTGKIDVISIAEKPI